MEMIEIGEEEEEQSRIRGVQRVAGIALEADFTSGVEWRAKWITITSSKWKYVYFSDYAYEMDRRKMVMRHKWWVGGGEEEEAPAGGKEKE